MRFAQPKIGEKITIKCKNSRDTFIGEVLPSDNWVGPNRFTMTSGYPDYYKFPRRVISLDNIETLVYEKDDIVPEKEEEVVITIHKIKGSKGNIYTVKQEGNAFHCDCPGHKWRGHCKHVKALQDE